ncbi:MAG: UxaA family hydrolase, partial [Planctomycetota bacterium]
MNSKVLKGFKRNDGRVGFRNNILVLPLTGCQMTSAFRIAEKVEGVTCFAHPNGCDLHGKDYELFGTIVEEFAMHPNTGGVIILAMGCAQGLNLNLPRKIKESGRLVEVINTHENSDAIVEKGVKTA